MCPVQGTHGTPSFLPSYHRPGCCPDPVRHRRAGAGPGSCAAVDARSFLRRNGHGPSGRLRSHSAFPCGHVRRPRRTARQPTGRQRHVLASDGPGCRGCHRPLAAHRHAAGGGLRAPDTACRAKRPAGPGGGLDHLPGMGRGARPVRRCGLDGQGPRPHPCRGIPLYQSRFCFRPPKRRGAAPHLRGPDQPSRPGRHGRRQRNLYPLRGTAHETDPCRPRPAGNGGRGCRPGRPDHAATGAGQRQGPGRGRARPAKVCGHDHLFRCPAGGCQAARRADETEKRGPGRRPEG